VPFFAGFFFGGAFAAPFSACSKRRSASFSEYSSLDFDMSKHPDPLAPAKLKIKRANTHIRELEQLLSAFLNTDPKPVRVGWSPRPNGEKALIAQISKPLPEDATVIVGETAVQLRSALDKVVGALAVLAGETATGTKFPFGGDRNPFPSAREQASIKKLSADAQALIIAQKPYLGGNDLLWAVNKLANTDKHWERLILVGGGANTTGTVDINVLPGLPGHYSGPMNFYMAAGGCSAPLPLNQEVVLMSMSPNLKCEVQITFEVIFGEIECIEGKSVVATLNQMSGLVESIVLTFENRFFVAGA
jgi:hypothetical protein